MNDLTLAWHGVIWYSPKNSDEVIKSEVNKFESKNHVHFGH